MDGSVRHRAIAIMHAYKLHTRIQPYMYARTRACNGVHPANTNSEAINPLDYYSLHACGLCWIFHDQTILTWISTLHMLNACRFNTLLHIARYDLIIMDHSINDHQDFLRTENRNTKAHLKSLLDSGAISEVEYVNKRITMDVNRVNDTFAMVISQLRALESAPALLFTQFGGLQTAGYATGEKDAFGYKGYQNFDPIDYTCFDLRLPENQKRFDLPGTDDCWHAPSWIKSRGAEVKVQFGKYIDDGKHNIWCHMPDTWHIEDYTSAPIAEHGAPSISMRDIVWSVTNA